ncbi:hypothetical protein [Pseudomonas cremoricolorata]|uniref:hypothetical protein n=1 Tax=Pseudomonas cremoricolorata TaxID=157783 RepID=UPI00041701D4|nr:hypothetical protein [Pseudomonas cremoricolorata]
MPRYFSMFLVVLLVTLGGCDQHAGEAHTTRQEKILAQLPLEDAYAHNIARMAQLLAPRFAGVPQAEIDRVLREHLTVEDQRQDLFRLYSEENFSDAEFELVIAATADPAKARALNQSLEGRQLSEKLTRLMRASANDPAAKQRAAQRMQEVEQELRERQRQAPAP